MLHRILLVFCTLPLAAQVDLKQSSDRITIDINGKPFSELFLGPDVRKPYLHPLRAATGKVVTRMYPMEKVAGETADHPHHRGLWFNHGDVNGVDFWGSDAGARNDAKAKIGLKKVRSVKGGKKKGTIAADFDWTDKDGTVLINESRTMTFYAEAERRTVDLDITLKMAQAVKFGDTKEGSFAIRLADGLREQKGTGKMVNAEGAVGEKNVWGKASPWVDYAGTLDGEAVGIAILDHPSNPRHPTYWHARAYGLFASNIFGLHDFYNDKSKDGSMQLKAGDTLRFRFRVLIHAGDAAAAKIADEFQKYSAMK